MGFSAYKATGAISFNGIKSEWFLMTQQIKLHFKAPDMLHFKN